MAEQQTPGKTGMSGGSFTGGDLGGRSAGQGQAGNGQQGFSMGGASSSARGDGQRFDQGVGQAGGAKEKLADAAGRAGEKVTSRLDTGKDRAADQLCRVADALRQTGNQLRDDGDDGPIEGYINSAAAQVDRFSSYVRSKSMREMVGNVEQFARQQPALFVGGAFMLGLIGARFLKSSSHSSGSPSRSIASEDSSSAAARFQPRRNMNNPDFERSAAAAPAEAI